MDRFLGSTPGLFTHFESGVRTDAELRDNAQGVVAALEWEWDALHTRKVKEFKKLAERCQNPDLACPRFVALVVYGRTDGTYSMRTKEVLEEFERDWSKDLPPLLLVVVYYEGIGKEERQDERLQRRQFGVIEMYKIAGGNPVEPLRRQPALPWDVKGSRWAKETASTS